MERETWEYSRQMKNQEKAEHIGQSVCEIINIKDTWYSHKCTIANSFFIIYSVNAIIKIDYKTLYSGYY